MQSHPNQNLGQLSFEGEEATTGLPLARWGAWQPTRGPGQAVCVCCCGPEAADASDLYHIETGFSMHLGGRLLFLPARLGGLPSDAQAGCLTPVTLGPVQSTLPTCCSLVQPLAHPLMVPVLPQV